LERIHFFDYYSGIKEGFALELKHMKLFKAPIDPKVIFPHFTPPQSFYYLDDTLINVMEKIEDGEQLTTNIKRTKVL